VVESGTLLRCYTGLLCRGFESLSLRQFVGRAGLVLFVLVVAGCGQSEQQQIKWQLPLAAPTDPHSATADQPLPPWAGQNLGSADLMLLQKDTARRFDVPLESGKDSDFKDLHLRLLGLADGLRLKSGSYIDDKNVHNPAAFVEISRSDKLIYRGWLYQEFPELFGPDMENWKIWLRGVTIKQAPAVQDNTVPNNTTGTRP
jgi:hypothetical protein